MAVFSILSPELHELRLCNEYFDMASNNILANNGEKLSSERFLSFTDNDDGKFCSPHILPLPIPV